MNPREAQQRLEVVASDLTRIRVGDDITTLQNYCQWVGDSLGTLRSHFAARTLDELLLTRRYWALQGTGTLDTAGWRRINLLLELEIQERRQAFERVIQSLRDRRQIWDDGNRHYRVMLDTTVMVEHRDKLTDIDWAETAGLEHPHAGLLVIIPMQGVEELDRLKRHDQTRHRAREALGLIEGVFSGSIDRPVLQRQAESLADGSVRGQVWFMLQMDEPGHERMPTADQEIIDQAVALQAEAGRAVTLLTFDLSMTIQARAMGLDPLHLPESLEREPVQSTRARRKGRQVEQAGRTPAGS